MRLLTSSTTLIFLAGSAFCSPGTKTTPAAYTASISSVASSISAGATESAYPLPMPCTGEGCTEHAAALQDFNIIQHKNGTFYRVSKDNGTATGLTLASAPNIAGPWVLQRSIFGPSASSRLRNLPAPYDKVHLWTPELHYFNNAYYLFYSVNAAMQHPLFQLRVATSPNMDDDTWTDHGSMGVPQPLSTQFYAAIDGSLLSSYGSDAYGAITPYNFVFGGFGAFLFGIGLLPDDPTQVMLPVAEQLQPLIQDQLSPVQTPAHHPNNNRTEGSFHMEMNGYIYFFFSRGSCCAQSLEGAYITQVCRATDASGPYVDRLGRDCAGYENGTLNDSGTTILQSHSPNAEGIYQVLAPGSVGIVAADEGPIITYQYRNQSIRNFVPEGLSFGYNYLSFDDQGWPFLSEAPKRISTPSSTSSGMTTSVNPTGTTTTSSTSTPTSNAAAVASIPFGASFFTNRDFTILGATWLVVCLVTGLQLL